MAKIDPATVQTIILDAGPLIHLDELGCLSLLLDFQNILVSDRNSKTLIGRGNLMGSRTALNRQQDYAKLWS